MAPGGAQFKAIPLAVEHIRRMRGGAQSHLMRADDGGYYIVKFQNNPQHVRVLANELLGGRIAEALGLPVARPEVIEVTQELIEDTPELHIQKSLGREACRSGLQFGSRYPGDPTQMVVHDLLPDERLREVGNLSTFLGMLVFDRWTCNTNGRQVIFHPNGSPTHYRAMMIDQGFCFNAGDWNFPDSPLRGLYLRQAVYQSVRSFESFQPFLHRVERIPTELLDRAFATIPPEWYDFDQDALLSLVERLYQRRKWIREMLVETRDCFRRPFPNWTN
jgi:hypothetical protein